jgi:hypothetical protein
VTAVDVEVGVAVEVGVSVGVRVAVWIVTDAEVLVAVGTDVVTPGPGVVRVGEEVGVAVTTTVTTWTTAELAVAEPSSVGVLETVAVAVTVPGVELRAASVVASGEVDATGEAAPFVFWASFTAVPVAVGLGLPAMLGASDPRAGSAGLLDVTPPVPRPDVGAPGEIVLFAAGAGTSAWDAFGSAFPTVVPVEASSEIIAASGSPVATSTAVTPPTASKNPTIAVAPTVTMAPREIMPNACWAAAGEVATVLTTPSRRSLRAEKPAATRRRSSVSSGARTTSLTLDPMVAPIIAPTRVPWTPAQEVKTAPQTAARPAVTIPAR